MWRAGFSASAALKGSHCDAERTLQIINKTQFKASPSVLSISLQLQENSCAYLHVPGVLSKDASYFLLKHFCN